jgi:long-chain acyl-CoA synthetase
MRLFARIGQSNRIKNMNAAQLALDNIARYGEYTATWFEGRAYTNVERYDAACRMAATLGNHGVGRGDRVVVMMLNSPDVTAAFIALWQLGAVMIPVTPMWNARELRYVLEDSGATLAITSPELAARVTEAAAGLPAYRETLVIGDAGATGAVNVQPEFDAATPLREMADCEPDELAMLLYTSGTTGNPKGVMLSHDNLLYINEAIYANNRDLGQLRGLQVLPLSHVYGVLMMNLGFRMGTAAPILRQFEAGKVLETIQNYRVQRMALVPTMLVLLMNHPDRARYDTSSLEFTGSGGAPLPEGTRLEFERLFSCKVMQGYGMSETSGALTGYHPDDAYRPGSVGLALPGVEICVMDFENRVLPAGEVGELCSRGRHIMQGYLNKPEATRDTIVDGWLHTGDIGYLDADGYVFITDRKKDLVIKGGENISPREIEEGLYSHPSVAEAAVFGVPDPVYGENLVATLVLKPGQTATEDEIKAYIGGYVTKFKIPSRVIFLDALPKNPSGKILKRTLREQFS